MCGIAGILGTASQMSIRMMCDAIGHRGPDGSDIFRHSETHLAMTRLSIVGGNAPIILGDDLRIVFNGEIYNHKELRRALESDGYVFKTKTDTEVVLQLYRRDGLECFQQLEGMFALAIFDADTVILARDRLGIKPLYISRTTGGLVFASEIKAILQSGLIEPELDNVAMADQFVLRMMTGHRTYIKGISLFPEGNFQTFNTTDASSVDGPQPYYMRTIERPERSFKAAVDLVVHRLDAVVTTHMSADTEIGVTLSGGLDSTLLAALARRHTSGPLKTFAVADIAENPDLIEARKIAQCLGTDHREQIIDFESYLSAVPDLVATEESPPSLFGLPLLMLSRLASGNVKACLHGEGADEVFGGYSEYLDRHIRLAGYRERLERARKLDLPVSVEALNAIHRQTPTQPINEYLKNIFDLNLRDQLQQRHLLPVDKCGMACGLEYRVPYLDDTFFAEASTLPLDHSVRYDLSIGKRVLKHAFLEVLGPKFLDTVLRAKVGGPSAGTQSLRQFNQICGNVLPNQFPRHQEHAHQFFHPRDALMFDMFHDQFIKYKGNASERKPVLEYLLELSVDRFSRVQLSEMAASNW
jgi:asparagine synthase (glutamine-hydrolysing)